MTYRKGDLQMTVPQISDDCDERGTCWTCEERGLEGVTHGVRDSRGGRETAEGAYLPHACEEWVIGGPREIDALIRDLEAAKAMFEEREKA
jgi:hypothetical protein